MEKNCATLLVCACSGLFRSAQIENLFVFFEIV